MPERELAEESQPWKGLLKHAVAPPLSEPSSNCVARRVWVCGWAGGGGRAPILPIPRFRLIYLEHNPLGLATGRFSENGELEELAPHDCMVADAIFFFDEIR